MSSSNHRLRKPVGDECKAYGSGDPLDCAIAGCSELATWIAEYDYVTGRAGRVTTARKRRCDKHAAAFEKKYLFLE